jgi:hypothetical protein
MAFRLGGEKLSLSLGAQPQGDEGTVVARSADSKTLKASSNGSRGPPLKRRSRAVEGVVAICCAIATIPLSRAPPGAPYSQHYASIGTTQRPER